jgi:aldose 1-epimerase
LPAYTENADKTRSITVTTDRNAIVAYTSNYFDNKQLINGIYSKPYIGIALEVQTLPDAIHHKGFGDVITRSKIKEYKTIIKMCQHYYNCENMIKSMERKI